MTRAAWERTITDSAGNVLTGVQIAVFQQDGTTPATIYGQLNGGAALANPFNTGAQTSAKFYADPGRYVIRAVKDGQTKEFTDVDIADKAIRDDVGTAAYLTATQNRFDATQGRVMRIGDLGFAGGTVQVPDLKEVIPSGIYREENPEHGIAYASTLHMNSNDGRQQLTLGRAGYRMAFRGSPFGANGSGDPGQYWSPWAEVFHNYNIVGPVFYDSLKTVPTGAIIENGANANGRYIKFADGTLICVASPLAIANQLANVNVGAYGWSYYYENNSIQFPAAFIAPPEVQVTPRAAFLSATVISISGTGFVVAPISTYQMTSADQVMYLAIGRWRA